MKFFLKIIILFYLFTIFHYSLYACIYLCAGTCTNSFIDLTKITPTFLNWKHEYSLNTPVNFAKVSKEHFILTDYKYIHILDFKNNSIWKPNFENFSENDLHPTGIYYSKKRDLIFVANYHKKNILILKLSHDGNYIKLINTITHPLFKGPEGISFSEKHNLLYVADHDANKVISLLIDRSDETPQNHPIEKKEFWSKDILVPHGIDAGKDYLYVASIRDRTIKIIDLMTGKTIKSIGKRGISSCNVDFLWPAFVYEWDENRVIVTDGHTGYVKLVNWKENKVEKVLGGNGPGRGFFHNPASIVFDENNFYLLSIFQFRIFKINKFNMQVKDDFFLLPKNQNSDWSWFNNSDYQFYSIDAHINDWKLHYPGHYIHKFKSIKLSGDRYKLGYGGLHIGGVFSRLPYSGEFGYYGGYHYFVDKVDVPDVNGGYILFSYTSPGGIIIFNYNNFIQMFPIYFACDMYSNWNFLNTPINSCGPLHNKDNIPVTNLFSIYSDKAKEIKSLSAKQIIDLLFRTIYGENLITIQNPLQEMENWFITKEGKAFYQVLKDNLNDEKLLIKQAKHYFKNLAKEAKRKPINKTMYPIHEIGLVSMLSKTYIPLKAPDVAYSSETDKNSNWKKYITYFLLI